MLGYFHAEGEQDVVAGVQEMRVQWAWIQVGHTTIQQVTPQAVQFRDNVAQGEGLVARPPVGEETGS